MTAQLISIFVFTTIPYFLNPKNFKPQAIFCSSSTTRFVLDLVGNPEDRFCHEEAHILAGNLSLVMRKPGFCICVNKDADQLRGNREADQHLCFRYMDSTILLILNFKSLTILCGCTAQFVWNLVGNPEDRFSHYEAHLSVIIKYPPYMRRDARKSVLGVSDEVRHKPGCTVPEDG